MPRLLFLPLCHSFHVIKCMHVKEERNLPFSFIFETTHKILGWVLGGLETSLRTRTQGEILEMKAWLRTSSEWGVGWALWQVDLFEAAASSSQRCSWTHPWGSSPPGSAGSAGPHPWPQVGRMGRRRVSSSEGWVKSGAQSLRLTEFDSKFSNRSITPQMARRI